MLAYVFPKAVEKIISKEIDFANDTFKSLLLTSSYSPNIADEFVSDVDNEVADATYSRQTVTISEITISQGTISVDVSDPLVFGTVSGSFQYIMFYKEVTVDGDSPLISMIDYGDTLVSGREVSVSIANIFNGSCDNWV